MSIALKGLAGPLVDKIIVLKAGMTLGRQGDVVIADTKASALHARVERSEQGKWSLEDNASKNGTRVKGERIQRATLKPGLVFYIGDQGFTVVDLTPKAEVTATQEGAPPAADAAAPKAAPKTQYWYEALADALAKNSTNLTDSLRPISPLHPALVLDFTRGLQMNSRWTLGYGPRKLGSASLDLPLYEPGAPPICFEVTPSAQGILFKTAYPQTVLLNGQAVDSQVLRVGDTIQISETLIEVDFVE